MVEFIGANGNSGTTTGTMTVDVPEDTQPGDLIVAGFRGAGHGGGFNFSHDQWPRPISHRPGGTGDRIRLWMSIAPDPVPEELSWTHDSGNDNIACGVAVWRGVDPFSDEGDLVVVEDNNADGGAGDIVAPNASVSEPSLVVRLWTCHSASGGTSGDSAVRLTASTGDPQHPFFALGENLAEEAGDSGTATISTTASSERTSATIGFAAEVDGEPPQYDPENLVGEQVGDDIHLSCDPSPTDGVNAYSWHRAESGSGLLPADPEDPGFLNTEIAETSDPEYVDEDPGEGLYEYQVFGVIP